jgi:hypothetical protein
MISVSLLGSKDGHSSTSSLLELDMGSDSQNDESADSQSSSMEMEDEVLISMLVQLENGMFKKRHASPEKSATDQVVNDIPPAPSRAPHTQSTPEAARKFLHRMGESLSCECMFTTADLVGIADEGLRSAE